MGALLVTLLMGLRPTLTGPEALRDTARFRVHYTLAGDDAPPHGAADADAVAAGLDATAARWIDTLGMRAPLPDGGEGGDARIDVYLRRLASARGLTHPEDAGLAPAASAWIELDPRTALISPTRLAAAAAHEAHHAIEYAYSSSLAPWIYEATAAWVEHADFTDAALQAETDAHFAALLDHPEVPLDMADGVHEYDEMVFVKFLVDRRGDPRVVRALWEAMAKRADAIAGLRDTTALSPTELLAEFGRWNLHACAADDGHHYDPARAACRSADRAAPPGTGTVPATVAAALGPLAIAWWSVPVDPCHPARAVFAGAPHDLAASVDETAATVAGPLTLAGPGPSAELVVATGPTAPAPALSIAFSSADSPCSDGSTASPTPVGCSCTVGTSHRRGATGKAAPATLTLLFALRFALRFRRRARASGGAGSPADRARPSPSGGRSTPRASRSAGATRRRDETSA